MSRMRPGTAFRGWRTNRALGRYRKSTHDGTACARVPAPHLSGRYQELSGTIDDVTDSIEDVLLRLYMFNIRTLRPEAQAFAQVIADCCAALKTSG